MTSIWSRRWRACGLAALVAAGLSACGGGSSDAGTPSTTLPLQVYYALAPVEGGACSLLDVNGKTLAGPTSTKAGVAGFAALPAGTTMALASCVGGSYVDLATGKTMSAPRLRSYLDVAGGASLAVVTPLTEIVVQLPGVRSGIADYKSLALTVASSFGLDGIDLAGLRPADLGQQALTDDNAGRYGAVLAVLSQLQVRATLGADAQTVTTRLGANFDQHANIREGDVHDEFIYAMEDLLDNTRLKSLLASAGKTVLLDLFEKLSDADPLASVTYINTDFSSTRSGLSRRLVAGKTSTIAIVGQDLYLGLEVRLGKALCTVRDLGRLETSGVGEVDDIVYADCPAVAAGTSVLTVMDGDEPVFEADMTVISASTALALERARAVREAPRAGTGPANILGTVTAQAPNVDPATGGHKYGDLRTFTVKGVVVELIDKNAGDAVLMQTSTDANGRYTLSGADAGKNVAVRVKAQLRSVRNPDSSTGPQWDIAVRDNTSTSSPKALFTLDSATLATVAGDTTVNVNAAVGFDAAGNPGADAERQSAPFAVLEVMYSATVKLQETDANLSLPGLNVYWSPSNVGASGDVEKGQIGTSHYAGGGTLPGVFILGKANVDTDEFDQGVIGHEFGHYLQAQLSFSDSPGGSHSNGDFKDASLAYGEGYGTAIGGLLSGSPYYIDSSGPLQARGGVTNLTLASAGGKRKGFYSEESVAYVMYNMGTRHGFTPLWRAVSTMRGGHESATIFNFLNRYVAANPDAAIGDLLAAENLRSTDLLGNLPSGAASDPAINAAASNGADDLELLYIPLTLTSAEPTSGAVRVSAVAPSFCLNHNLSGAKLHNGLGMLRRFVFTSSYTGTLGVKVVDDKGNGLDLKDHTLSARDGQGNPVSVGSWEQGTGLMAVVAGRSYTVRFSADSPASVFQGNRCGNNISLWR